MLTEQIGKLQSRLQDLSNLERLANVARQLSTRADQLERLRNELNAIAHTTEILRNHKVQVTYREPADGLISYADVLKKSFSKDRAQALQEMADDFAHRFKTPIESYCEAAEQLTTRAWKEHHSQCMPSVNMDLLNVLSNLRGFSGAVTQIKKHLEGYGALESQLPQNDEDFELFDKKLKDLNEALETLKNDNIPDEVVAFIRSAAIHGFPLGDINDDVLEWLRENDLLGQFVVRPA